MTYEWPEPKQLDIRKSFSVQLRLAEWKLIRAEATKRKIPMTNLIREWIAPEMAKLEDQ